MTIFSIVLERVVALGALSAGAEPSDGVYARAETIVSMAQELVLAYITKTETDVLALTDTNQQGVVYTVMAEAAATVLARNSVSSPAGYEMDPPFASVLLSDDQKAVLDHTFSTTTGTRSITIERAEESSWLGSLYPIYYPFDTYPT